MRLAFFGGSFDPPHRGHLAIARAAVQRLDLDRVWMAPVGAQPLKPDGFSTSFADRLAMVELTAASDAKIQASAVDAPRSDGQPNYTIDVLTAIAATLPSSDQLYFLLGADAFLSLKQWHGAEQLPFLCELIVAGRPGFSIEDVPAALPAGIHAARVLPAFPRSPANAPPPLVMWSLNREGNAKGKAQSRLYLMPDLHEDISATHIRAALAGEESEEGVLSPAVLRYIRENGLYR
jgi:nicotinate-nucleotide adenylyltransferase